jgi:hypothetical protein
MMYQPLLSHIMDAVVYVLKASFKNNPILLQVDGPSMFPTFAGKGDLVVAEALPGVTDRVAVGE